MSNWFIDDALFHVSFSQAWSELVLNVPMCISFSQHLFIGSMDNILNFNYELACLILCTIRTTFVANIYSQKLVLKVDNVESAHEYLLLVAFYSLVL